MNADTWLGIKKQQISLYRKQASVHKKRRIVLVFVYLLSGFLALTMPWMFLSTGSVLLGLGMLVFIPITMLVWKISTHENRAAQLLTQLADAVEQCIGHQKITESLIQSVTDIETRFLSNDDELFVKKDIWSQFLHYKQSKRNEELRYERSKVNYYKKGNFFAATQEPVHRWVWIGRIKVGPVWNTDIPHRQGYKDSNTIVDEWAIVKALRRLIFASDTEVFGVLKETSDLAKTNPVVFERYLRKKQISKKMKKFKWRAWVHYLSPAAKMRLVTFVDGVLALEPKALNEATVSLLHEKNQQIDKYTKEFWRVHRRSLKYYWLEALWLLLMIPFLAGAGRLIGEGAFTEAILLFTLGAALVAFGEMALIVRQKIKLNGKKLIPPLIASLIGSRHAMCADTHCETGVEAYRRRFKNLEKHFIMTTPEIDSVKYVKDNLQDETRTSKLNEAEDICQEAQGRMDTYYKMFHLYRRRCLQYGALELFGGIILVPVWAFALLPALYLGGLGIHVILPMLMTLTVAAFEILAIHRHIRVWRFKELYFKIYQGLSVLIVDGDLREDPEKLNNMFVAIEESALSAICNDPVMKLMAGTVSRVSGLEIPQVHKPHPMEKRIDKVIEDRINQLEKYAAMDYQIGSAMGTKMEFAAWKARFRQKLWR